MIYAVEIHEDLYRRSNNIKVCLSNLNGSNVGITDGRNL
jgi:hypothetical protein